MAQEEREGFRRRWLAVLPAIGAALLPRIT
jgi:hypothetical protein